MPQRTLHQLPSSSVSFVSLLVREQSASERACVPAPRRVSSTVLQRSEEAPPQAGGPAVRALGRFSAACYTAISQPPALLRAREVPRLPHVPLRPLSPGLWKFICFVTWEVV